MVQWLIVILVYDLAILKLSLCEVTLSIRLLHYKNRNGLTYENRPCDSRLEHDINRDGRCDTAFLFCLVRLPFQNPHNCTLGDHFTGFVGADDIHFVNIDRQPSAFSVENKKQRSSPISLWFQPTIYFHFKYPRTGIGLIVEVFDMDDPKNQTIHDSIDFYGRTLLDLKLARSADSAHVHRYYLRSLFGTYTNLTADFSLYCSANYYGTDCDTFCEPNDKRYECDSRTGQKSCKHGYLGPDCLSDVRACEDQPCLNNGTCVVYLRSFLCQCQKGYTGRVCEIGPMMKAADRKCNKTTCIHGDCSSTGKCICHDGWSAESCDQPFTLKQSACAIRPCLHNSTCENLIDIHLRSAYRCHCLHGYTGRNCEVAIVTACERTPCVHGQCLKIDLYTEICLCEDNWSGIDCSQAVTTSSLSPANIARLSNRTRKISPVTTMPALRSILPDTTTQASTQVLTYPPAKADLHNYLHRLNKNDTLSQTANTDQSIPASSTPSSPKSSPCSSSPCLHNSTCVIQSEQTFQCLCQQSFMGIYCEIERNLCENSPCQHQSICVTKSNYDIQCICRPNYAGKYCEHPPTMHRPTSPSPCRRNCRNGGVCSINASNDEQCLCNSSFTGVYCEVAKNNCSNGLCNIDPCTSNPCLSNGTCHATMPSKNFTCACLEQFTGERCEVDASADPIYTYPRDLGLSYNENYSSKSSTDLWPLAIVFGYVFSLMLVFIIIWFLWYGLTIRPRSYFHSDIPYGDRTLDRYQPYRLGVSNPLFFANQEHNPHQFFKTFSL